MLHCMKKLDYLCNYKLEISSVCNTVESHCLLAIKIVHHHANGRFDCLISEHQSVNRSREASEYIIYFTHYVFYRLKI